MNCPKCGSEMEERDHIEDMESLHPQDPHNPVYGPGRSDYGRRRFPYLYCPCGHEEKGTGDCTTCKHTRLYKDGTWFSFRVSCFKRRKLNLITCYESRGHEEQVKLDEK